MTSKGPIWCLGAMSGTSLDGVDAAVILTDGHDVLDFGRSDYRAYDDDERRAIRVALGQAHGPVFEHAAEIVETAHAELLSGFPEAELVGFHGQTTLHNPENALTAQAGNGALLAEVLDRPVVWDFRSTDVEMGGQGAPLAPFYHFALARKLKSDAPIAFVNIGGVANLTWIDPSKQSPDLDGACLAFDTGPGNALIDDLVFARTGERFDENGTLARSGTTDTDLLQKLFSENRYFSKIPPKSLDRDAFSDWAAAIAEKSLEDAAATLTAGTVRAITDGLDHCPKPPERLLVTGGGRKNPTLMAMLQDAVSLPVDTVEEVGFDGDMLEAQAFAYLAVRVLRGLPTSAPGTTGVAAPVGGGRVSRPGDLAKSQS